MPGCLDEQNDGVVKNVTECDICYFDYCKCLQVRLLANPTTTHTYKRSRKKGADVMNELSNLCHILDQTVYTPMP